MIKSTGRKLSGVFGEVVEVVVIVQNHVHPRASSGASAKIFRFVQCRIRDTPVQGRGRLENAGYRKIYEKNYTRELFVNRMGRDK